MSLDNVAHLAMVYDAFCGPSSNKEKGVKRRLEEILDYDLNFCMLDKTISSNSYRPDIKRSRDMYMKEELTSEISLPYMARGKELLGDPSGIVKLPNLSVPAFGRDSTIEVAGKFDLVLNTVTSLYTENCGPMEANHLLFQYMGLKRIPYSLGEKHPNGDPLKSIIQMEIYDERHEIRLDDGIAFTCNELEKEMRLMNRVHEEYSLRFGNLHVDPLATLISYRQLKNHIEETNHILQSQYLSSLRNESYIELKQKVVNQHRPNSVAALMVQIQSPEMFYDTFFPRGILSSNSTGKTVPFCDGKAYEGILTLQTTGLLNIDIEDGDQHMLQGSVLSSGFLYLIVEMKQLVPGDYKFNYPGIRMLLTDKTKEMVTQDILLETKGRCHLSRSGKLTKTIIKPVGKLSVGPHNVHDPCHVDARQYSQFDLLLSHCSPQFVIFTDSYEKIN